MQRLRPHGDWPRGNVVRFPHRSRVLAGNPWGDPVERELAVYLPPSYSESAAPFIALWDLAAFTNAGPGIAHGVILSDVLSTVLIDAEILYESPEVVGQKPGERYVWEIEDLVPGAGGEISLRVTVDPSAESGIIENVAELRAAEPDSVPSDNPASVSNELVVVADWYIYLPVVLKEH